MKKIKRLVCMLLSLMLISVGTIPTFAVNGILIADEPEAISISYDTVYNPLNGVIGDDEAIAITDYNTVSTYPYNAIVRILAHHEACGCKPQGTGFLISSRCIVTCGHNLIPCKHNNPCTKVEINLLCYQKNGQTYTRSKLYSYSFDYNSLYLTADKYDKINYDYGYVLLDTASANEVSTLIPKYFELSVLNIGPPYGMSIHVSGYRNTTLYDSSSRITNQVGTRIYHEADTKKGQSGSPIYVLYGDTACVYGINTTGHNTYPGNVGYYYPNSGRIIDNSLFNYYLSVK